MKTNNKINWDIVFKSAPLAAMIGVTVLSLIIARLFSPYTRMHGSWVSEHPNLYIWFYIVSLDLGRWIAEYKWRKINAIKKGLPVTWRIFFDTGFDFMARMVGLTIAIFIITWLAFPCMKIQHWGTEYPILYMWLYVLSACGGYWSTNYMHMKKSLGYWNVIKFM